MFAKFCYITMSIDFFNKVLYDTYVVGDRAFPTKEETIIPSMMCVCLYIYMCVCVCVCVYFDS